MSDRAILHSDANGFYASVEMVLNPELRGKAVAVCGSTEDRHGIVLAKSELAKKAGVKTGITIVEHIYSFWSKHNKTNICFDNININIERKTTLWKTKQTNRLLKETNRMNSISALVVEAWVKSSLTQRKTNTR